jgi:hypothetical protein
VRVAVCVCVCVCLCVCVCARVCVCVCVCVRALPPLLPPGQQRARQRPPGARTCVCLSMALAVSISRSSTSSSTTCMATRHAAAVADAGGCAWSEGVHANVLPGWAASCCALQRAHKHSMCAHWVRPARHTHSHAHLLVQVFKLGAGQLELRHLRQQHIPAPGVDVRHKRLYAVHRVERHVALVLQRRQRQATTATVSAGERQRRRLRQAGAGCCKARPSVAAQRPMTPAAR